jgi:putative PEP-CTERM system TPR-repeat lipoprotein
MKRIAVCLFGAVCAITAQAADVEGYLKDARGYLDQRDYKAAVIQLRNALQEDPEHGEARLLLGETYLRIGDPLAAEKELSRARELKQPRARWLIPLGRALLMSGRAGEVIKLGQDAADPPELQADLITLQAQALLAGGDAQRAEAQFDAALRLAPTQVEARLGKARVMLQAGKKAEATALIDLVLKDAPQNVEAWLIRGEIHRISGERDAALAAFSKAVELDPYHLPARLGRGTMLLMAGKGDDALKDIEHVRSRAPNLPLANYLHALILYNRQDIAGAETALQLALKYDPDHLPSLLLSGTLHYQQDQLNQAEEALRHYTKAQPKHAEALALLGATLIKKKEPQQAIELLKTALEQDPDQPRLLALLGSAQLQAGKSADGLATLERASQLAPDAAAIHAQLALGRLSQGNAEGAVTDLQKAVDIGGVAQADVLLVMARLHKKDFDAAIKTAQALAQKQPKDALPHNLMGAAYIGKQQPAEARRAFEQALTLQPGFAPAQLNLARLDQIEKKPEDARRRYQEVLTQDPDNLAALLALAALEQQSNKPSEALKWLEKAHAGNHAALEPALALVDHHLRQNEPLKALEVARTLNDARPKDPAALSALGMAQLAAGMDGSAVTTYTALTELAPKSAQAHFLLAQASLKRGDQSPARAALARALELQPDHLGAQLALIQLETKASQWDAALRIAGDIQKQRPKEAVGYQAAGDIERARKRYPEALAAYDAAFKLTPGAELALRRYETQLAAKNPAAAQAVLADWLKDHPDDANLRMFYGQSLQQSGERARAREEYSRVLKTQPNNLVVLNNLAWLHYEDGDAAGGVRYAEQAYQQGGAEHAEIADTLGWLLISNGQTERGLVLVQEALAKAPHIGSIRYHAAVAFDRLGRRNEARAELDRLLKTGESFPERGDAETLYRSLK